MNAIAITQVLERGVAQFRAALPDHIPVERFRRVAQTAILNNHRLMECDPRALLTELVKCAQDGLLPDGREAALVPAEKGKASYRPMYLGLLKIARNSGEISGISCELAYRGEHFCVVKGDEPRIKHRADMSAMDSGDWIAGYAIASLRSGEKVRAVMTRGQVLRIRDRSDGYRAWKAGKIRSNPWGTDEEEMAKKTVLKRLCKLLPRSTDKEDRLQQVIDRDNDEEQTVDASPVQPDQAPPPETRLDAIEDAIEVDAEPVADDAAIFAAETPPPIENATPDDLMAMADTRKAR